jgi:hypothetical protein
MPFNVIRDDEHIVRDAHATVPAQSLAAWGARLQSEKCLVLTHAFHSCPRPGPPR